MHEKFHHCIHGLVEVWQRFCLRTRTCSGNCQSLFARNIVNSHHSYECQILYQQCKFARGTRAVEVLRNWTRSIQISSWSQWMDLCHIVSCLRRASGVIFRSKKSQRRSVSGEAQEGHLPQLSCVGLGHS